MDFGLDGRTAFLLGESTSTTTACAHALRSEGVRVVSPDEADQADIVVAFGRAHPGSNAVEATLDDLYESWDGVVEAIAAYRSALPHMRAQQWGRFVWVGSAASRSLDADEDDLNVVATLGVRALHKVIAFDEGPTNILANTVLRGSDVTDQDVADAVAFLCSQGAGYLTGVTITVDGGTGSAVF
jgi:3-oxoacyl-[acyl-carrier protein] reductase